MAIAVLETTAGEVRRSTSIGCAGLYADRVAQLCGVDPQLQIVPFRGEYFELVPDRQFLVKNLIYPVPDSRFPFLGVHFTRMARGGIEAGPNAVLALKREGYTRTSVSPRDMAQMATYPGLWRMAWKYWRPVWARCGVRSASMPFAGPCSGWCRNYGWKIFALPVPACVRRHSGGMVRSSMISRSSRRSG